MDFSQELATYLTTVTDVTAIVGSSKHGRVFDHVMRQGIAFPALVIDEQGGVASEHLLGTTGLARGDYVIWAMGETVKETTDLWSAVRRHLQTFGPAIMNPDTAPNPDPNVGTMVHAVTLDAAWRDRGFFPRQDASQREIYYSSSRYQIWHEVPPVEV